MNQRRMHNKSTSQPSAGKNGPHPPFYLRMCKEERCRVPSDKALVGSVMPPIPQYSDSLSITTKGDFTRESFVSGDQFHDKGACSFPAQRTLSSCTMSPLHSFSGQMTKGTKSSHRSASHRFHLVNASHHPHGYSTHSRHRQRRSSSPRSCHSGAICVSNGATDEGSVKKTSVTSGSAVDSTKRREKEVRTSHMPSPFCETSTDTYPTNVCATADSVVASDSQFLSRDISQLKNLVLVDYVSELFNTHPRHKTDALHEYEVEQEEAVRREEENCRHEIKSTKEGDVLENDVLEGWRYWNQENPVVVSHPLPSSIIDRKEREETVKYRLYSAKYRELLFKATEGKEEEERSIIINAWLSFKMNPKRPVHKRSFYLGEPIDWVKMLTEQQNLLSTCLCE